MSKASTIKTLDDIISNEDRYDLNKIAFFAQTDDKGLLICDMTLFDVYLKYIKPFLTTYKTTTREREFYKYRPHLLSQDFYGTPYLMWLFLWANDRESPSRFQIGPTIKAISPNTLEELYNTLVTKSSDRLYENWSHELRKVGEEII